MQYHGSCHCGQIAFDVDGEIDSVLECNCSICTKKGYLHWFVPKSQLTALKGEDIASVYTFHTGKIRHLFCPSCGCAPLGLGEHNGVAMAAINARCLDDVDLSAIPRVPYDGRNH